jgi:hypothetical protein
MLFKRAAIAVLLAPPRIIDGQTRARLGQARARRSLGRL